MNTTACLHTTARRLRFLRRHPNPYIGQQSPTYCQGMAHAYEYALRVILDEFCIKDGEWHTAMYGPQSEDQDLQYPE